MKLKPFILFSLTAVCLSGCAGLNEKEKAEMSRQILDLRASLDDTNVKIQELNNKFFLLHEKVESTRASVERLSAVPATPPEGLKVVALGDAGPKRAGDEIVIKAPGAEKIKEAEKVEDREAAVKAVKTAPAPAAAPTLIPDANTREAAYSRGQELFTSGRYKEARKVFMGLVRDHPKGRLADNALYWVGESYYTEKDFERAISTFKEVVDKYPGENKAPDALLKTGLAYLEINRRDKAKKSLEAVLKRYPDTEAAEKAKKTLEKISGVKEGSR